MIDDGKSVWAFIVLILYYLIMCCIFGPILRIKN